MWKPVAVLLLLITGRDCRADSPIWPPRAIVAASPSGRLTVVVVPRFRMQRDGLYEVLPTIATWLLDTGDGLDVRHAELGDAWPLHVAVADDGALVLIDAWGGNEDAPVIRVHAANGTLRREFRIDDLYSPERQSRLRRSVSSIFWYCPSGTNPWRADGSLEIPDLADGIVAIDPAATMSYRTGAGGPCITESDAVLLDAAIAPYRYATVSLAALAFGLAASWLRAARNRDGARA